jgi:hypothetical protein
MADNRTISQLEAKPRGDVGGAKNLPARLSENFLAFISESSRQTLPIWFPASSD